MAGNFGRGSSKAARTARRNARVAAKTGTNRYGKLNINVDAKQIANHLANHKITKALGLSGFGNWAASKVPAVGKFNHSLKTRVKAKIGEKNYRSTSANNPGSGVMPREVLEFYERYNPDGKSKQDFEKLYANQLKEGATLEQAMASNPAETMSYYALLDLDDKPTKNESLKVNNTKENKNMSAPLMGPLVGAGANILKTINTGSGNKSNASTDNEKAVDALYQKHLGRSGDFKTTGGASYWSDKVGTAGHSLAEIENALVNSQEGKKYAASVAAGNPTVSIGGLDSSASTYGQGTGDNVWAGAFQPGGALEGGSSAFTANQIAKNTGQVPNFFQASDADLAGLGGGGGTVDPPVTTQPVTDPLPAPVTPDPAKDKGGMDDFMKFMMLMSVMGGGRGFGGGGGYGGSQYGYGGLNPGGVQAAYNPLEHLQGMGDWFKNNFGSGVQGGTTLTT